MTPDQFRQWLLEMKISGTTAARLLEVTANSISNYKRIGSDKRTALACAALLDELKPYGEEMTNEDHKSETIVLRALDKLEMYKWHKPTEKSDWLDIIEAANDLLRAAKGK
jgi:hypothetical protein